MGAYHADSHPPHRRQVRDRARLAAGLLHSGRRPLHDRRLQWRIANAPILVLQPQGQLQDQSRGGCPDVHGTGGGAGRHRPRRAVAEAGRGRSSTRRIPDQDHATDSSVHADPPGLTCDQSRRIATLGSPRTSTRWSCAMSDRWRGPRQAVVTTRRPRNGESPTHITCTTPVAGRTNPIRSCRGGVSITTAANGQPEERM